MTAPRIGHDELPSSAPEESALELYEHAPCGYLSTAADGTVLRVNATLLRWLGTEREAVMGRRFQDLLPRGHRVLWQTHHQRALLHTGRCYSGALDLLAAGGSRLPVLISGELVHHGDAPPVVRLTLFDARERRAHEARLVAARDVAEEAERQVSALQRVTGACAAALSQQELFDAVVRIGAEELVARGAGVWLPSPQGGLLRVAAVDLDDPAAPRRAQDTSSALLGAWSTGEVVTQPLPAGPGRTSPGVLVAVPLVDGARCDGVLGLLLPGAADRGRVLLAALGAQVAQALTRLRSHAEVVRRQAFTDALLDNVDVGIVACDADGRLTTFNSTARRWHGGLDAEGRVAPQDIARRYDLYEADGTTPLAPTDVPLLRALREGRIAETEVVIAPAGLEPVRVLCSGQRLVDEHGSTVGAVVVMHDVTVLRAREQALRASAAFHDAVLVASPDLVLLADPESGAVLWTSREVPGLDPDPALAHPDDVARLRAADSAARRLPDGEVLQVRYRVSDGAGGWRWLARRVTPFARDASGRVVQVLATARDVTDVVEVEQRLEAAALHDPLTGLPNRSLLAAELRRALARVEPGGRAVAVLFVDLDGFKQVNDTAGHAAGDAVLQAVAARLRAALRPQDTVARVGGDEFVLVLDPVSDRPGDGAGTTAEARALAVAQRISAAVAEPVAHAGVQHEVTASIGLAFAGSEDVADDVLRDADTAMYRAKRAGKDRHEVFRPVLRSQAVARATVERELREALRAGGGEGGPALAVAYQPVIDLASGAVVGVEALARLTGRGGVSVPPDVFIPVAEETGLIGALGDRVLGTACSDLAGWRRDSDAGQGLGVSVNLSAHQARLGDLGVQVRGALEVAGLPPGLLTLELTESALLEADRAAVATLEDLRRLGVGISIDDFGTGWASLRYLTELPVTGVKIDRSFTAGLPEDAAKSTIVRLVATLAAELGLGCVVEGVETPEQLQALPPGVLGQGYLLGRPQPAGAISRLLAVGPRS